MPLRFLSGPLVDPSAKARLWSRTLGLVDLHWHVIERMAEALLACERLSGEEAMLICDIAAGRWESARELVLYWTCKSNLQERSAALPWIAERISIQ